MRNIFGSCSITNNSDKAISDSEAKWQGIKTGSFIKFGADSCFYQVAKTIPYCFCQDFTVVSDFQIKIKGDYSAEIFKNDRLLLTYKEYELLTINSIINGGKNYKVGDVISIVGGALSVNKVDNTHKQTQLKINQVDENGSITRVGLVEKGIYINPPQQGVFSGGSGDGALFDIEYNTISQRQFINVCIRNVIGSEKETIIFVDSLLPAGLKTGSISVNKWELYINGKYNGETKIGDSYEIYSDFTPYIKLPVLLKNQQNPEIVINKAFSIIDSEIGHLKAQLEFLLTKV